MVVIASPRSAFVALAAAVLAFGCGANHFPIATEADAARVATTQPGTTAAELNTGRDLLLRACGNCHQTPAPQERAAAEWPAIVQKMSEGAGVTPLDAQRIERYLAAFAKDRPAAALGSGGR